MAMPFLPVPQPYDFELSTGRFRAFGPDRANLWHDGTLFRAVAGREVRIEGAPGGVRVEPLDDETRLVVLKLLGAEFDLGPFSEFTTGDAVLSHVVRALRGLRPPLAPDPFEALVTSVTAQQVSLFAAFAIRNRLIDAFGVPVGRATAFPERRRLAAATPDDLVPLGFSRRKAETVVGLARAEVDYGALAGLPDEDVKATLTSLRGIGEWTADWFLARHLARPQAWPAGDLGLRKAVTRFYGGGRDLSTEEVRRLGSRFEPFQNLTAHYLLTAGRMLP